jgi:hypothetical protein
MRTIKYLLAIFFSIAVAACGGGGGGGSGGGGVATASTPPHTVASLPTSVAPPPAGNGIPYTVSIAEGPLDLSAFGYAEEEFIVSGLANIYQYGPTGEVVVQTAAVPYATRILVRRPLNPRLFSGNVYVETSHPQYGLEFIWPKTVDYIIANGDAYVSIATIRSGFNSFQAMKAFDPIRYAPLNFADPGLNWDVIGQVGSLLKTQILANPLYGYGVKRLYAEGWSGGGAVVLMYISDGFHTRVRMPDGGPIFDGYLVGEPSGYSQINGTTPPIPTTDPRQQVQPIDVPAISLDTHPQESYRRRPDGDAPSDRYRVYEVAGAAHSDVRDPRIYNQSEDVFSASRNGCVYELSRFPMHHFFKSTLARLDAWAARGVTPPPSQRMALKADGTPMLDVHGNPVDGVRSSYLDVPTARYFANAAASASVSGCPNYGAQERFSPETLNSLYHNHFGYVNEAIRRINELERDGWLLPAEAQELRVEALASPAF